MDSTAPATTLQIQHQQEQQHEPTSIQICNGATVHNHNNIEIPPIQMHETASKSCLTASDEHSARAAAIADVNAKEDLVASASAVTETVCMSDTVSHVVTIQISTNNNNNAFNLNNNNNINSQCKSKVSIVSFGPPETNKVSSGNSIVNSKQSVVEMVQKTNSGSDLEVNNATYLYYMMTSGQCSPSDTLDSGTCSDIEVTPPPLPKKMSPKTKVLGDNNKNGQNYHQRVGSFTDSEESESSLSCDSLNFANLCGNVTNDSLINVQDRDENIEEDSLMVQVQTNNNSSNSKLSFLPDSLLQDIRDRSMNLRLNETKLEKMITDKIQNDGCDSEEMTTTRTILMEKINSLNNNNKNSANSSIDENILKNNKNKNNYETDKFYKFHINEHLNVQEVMSSSASSVVDDDESFAGFKDLNSGTSTIRSNKGTVRGVKNRVRNGIATFLQMQHQNVKSYKEKDGGKVVVYTTSMGIVRETYTKCANVKQILKTLLVKFEERDVFMSSEYQQEIKDRMQNDFINVPQVFVDGQHIGDAESVERLNETGELRKMLKPYKCLESSFTCKACGGYRLLPCPSCGGSKKSIHRNHFTAEFVALKCMNCDEVGLVKCYNC